MNRVLSLSFPCTSNGCCFAVSLLLQGSRCSYKVMQRVLYALEDQHMHHQAQPTLHPQPLPVCIAVLLLQGPRCSCKVTQRVLYALEDQQMHHQAPGSHLPP
jgi:hypothetical protein